jgi:hypothetical protein
MLQRNALQPKKTLKLKFLGRGLRGFQGRKRALPNASQDGWPTTRSDAPPSRARKRGRNKPTITNKAQSPTPTIHQQK